MQVNFEKYDEENPKIWELFVRLSFQTKRKGFSNYGAFGIINLIRWHTSGEGNDGYKINNNYAPDYARKMEREYKEFEGFFRHRALKNTRVKVEEKQKRETWRI